MPTYGWFLLKTQYKQINCSLHSNVFTEKARKSASLFLQRICIYTYILLVRIVTNTKGPTSTGGFKLNKCVWT